MQNNGNLNGSSTRSSDDDIRNVIIIGSGPSGYTAALYTARANLNPLLIAGSLDPMTSRIKGGQLMATSDIENFPGAITVHELDMNTVQDLYGDDELNAISNLQGISGPNLMKRMELQARHFGAEMIEEFVTEVNLCEAPSKFYTVKLADGREFKTRALIIATGAAARTLGIEAEAKFFGQGGGVSTCATCDGASYSRQGSTVAVVGGGDSAMEEASYLARLDGIPKVYIIHRRDEFRASKIMLKRAQENPKIEFVLHSQIVDILGKPHKLAESSKFFADKEVVRAVVIEDTRGSSGTSSTREIELDGIFVAIGHTPNTDLFKNQLKMDEAGYLEHDKHMRALPSMTCVNPEMKRMEHLPGVFVAGDVADHVYRQAITAAGMGCQAAIEAERFLAEALAEESGLSADAVDISSESIAQSHWRSKEEGGEDPIINRVEEVVGCEAQHEVAEVTKS